MQEAQATLSPAGILFSLLFPAVGQTYVSGVVADVRLNQLITIEAIRLHAAEHGSLPDSLADLDVAPARVNPRTNSAFDYSVGRRTGNQQSFTLGDGPDSTSTIKGTLKF